MTLAPDSRILQPLKMKLISKTAFIAFSCLIFFSSAASAQTKTKASTSVDAGVASTMLRGSAKVAVIVVGSAAKVAWATTKFGAKHIAEPLILKAGPKIAMRTLKTSGVAAKYLLPFAVKLSLL